MRSLAIGFALIALLALPAPAGAVLSGTNGRIVFINGPAFGNTQLFLRSVTSSTGAGSTTGPLATGLAQQHRHPTWSPDRTKVAFAEGPGGATGYDIYILDLTTPGATPQNITNSPGVTDDRPAWSPDGTRIAYESADDIIVYTLNGGGKLPLTTTLTPKAWKAAWSPDSQTLYYSVGDVTQPPNGNTNDVRLYQQPANNSSPGTELLHVSGAHVFQPSISPDGTNVCYTLSGAAGNSTTAAVVAAPLSAPSQLKVIAASGKGDYNCTWSPDGTKIAFTEDFAANGEIFMMNSDGTGIPIDLTNAPGVFDGNPDWAPDGRPTCPDAAASTTVNTPVTITVVCTDTGPAYEQSTVRDFNTTNPSNGTLKQDFAGDPFIYTPNAGFVGTDSFKVGSFDDFGFGSNTGTVTVTVQAPAGGGGTGGGTAGGGGTTGGPGGTGQADLQAPVLSSLRSDPKRFAVGRASTPVSARVRRGTNFRFSASETGAATLEIRRLAPGRRVGQRCVRPTARNRRARRCRREVRAGTLHRQAIAGANTVRFTGRIGRRALRPAAYRVVVTVTDAAGNTSSPASASFRVVRG